MVSFIGSGSKQYLKTIRYDCSLNLLANVVHMFGGECDGMSNRPWEVKEELQKKTPQEWRSLRKRHKATVLYLC